MVMQSAYWMVVVGGIVAWVMAYGIGANDVANAFATSVGSHTLKLKWAIAIAAVMETLGAIFLGGSVSDTISGGVANPKAFAAVPDVFAYGMLCALAAAAVWLLFATYYELPVSTTHSIIGGVIGFALVAGGAKAVIWNKRKDEFPYISGVTSIVASWFISPLVAGLLSSILFFILRAVVLRSPHSATRAIWCLPILLAITIFVNLCFILLKGAKKVINLSVGTSLMICGVSGVGAAIIGGAIGMPLLFRAKKKWDKTVEDQEAQGKSLHDVHLSKSKSGSEDLPSFLRTVEVSKDDKSVGAFFSRVRNMLTGGLNADVFECIGEDAALGDIHSAAERFDPRAEQVFKYLQVISAAAVSFAHGANDVANAVGPFAAIYGIYNTGSVSSKSAVEPWMLGGIGSTGIVIGLATWGWRIMRVLGVKMTCITPSRGFTMETTTALVTAFGSYAGIPLSTTQTHVGSTTGVGLTEGRRGSVKWTLLLKMFAGWVFTLIIGAAISAALFAWGTFAPNLDAAIANNQLTSSVARSINDTLLALSADGNRDPAINATLASLNTAVTPPKGGVFPSSAVDPTVMSGLLDNTSAIIEKSVRLPSWLTKTVG